uniref:PX domain-containing protein n=1 Tax=Plectus sambesii TaxID=2011161 RepID=A0A914XKB9_9BILA
MSAPVEAEKSPTTNNDLELIESPGLPDLTTPQRLNSHHHDHTDEDICSQCSGDGSDYDEYEYCDCMLEQHQQPIPGAPGKRGVIPYKAVYDSQDDARKRGYWIPGAGVVAKIVKAERDSSSVHLFNQFVYTIALEHGPFKWTVQKRYRDFTHLNNRLIAHRAAERIRAPARSTFLRAADDWSVRLSGRSSHLSDLEIFSRKSRATLPRESLSRRCSAVTHDPLGHRVGSE